MPARIGFAVGTPEAVAPMFRIASQFASGMWRPLQEAAVEALTHGDGIDESNVEYSARQAAGRALLEALGCSVRPGQVGMFLWARVPDAWTGDTLSDALLDRAHVFLTPVRSSAARRPAPPPVPVHAPRPHSGGAPTH